MDQTQRSRQESTATQLRMHDKAELGSDNRDSCPEGKSIGPGD